MSHLGPIGTQPGGRAQAVPWVFAGVLVVGVVVAVLVLRSGGNGSSGAGPGGNPVDGGARTFATQAVVGNGPAPGNGASGSGTQSPEQALLKQLRLGGCFETAVDGTDFRATKLAPCSDPTATFFVEKIIHATASNKYPSCPNRAGYRTNVAIYKSDGFTTDTVLCLSPNWVIGRCYVVDKSATAVFDLTACATAKDKNGVQAVSVKRGTTNENVCAYPLEGWPNDVRDTVTCVREYR